MHDEPLEIDREDHDGESDTDDDERETDGERKGGVMRGGSMRCRRRDECLSDHGSCGGGNNEGDDGEKPNGGHIADAVVLAGHPVVKKIVVSSVILWIGFLKFCDVESAKRAHINTAQISMTPSVRASRRLFERQGDCRST